jgi:hypothetical protein
MAALHINSTYRKEDNGSINLSRALSPLPAKNIVLGLWGFSPPHQSTFANESSLPFIDFNHNHSTIKYY